MVSDVSAELRAPFPWFGGKRRVAAAVWARFGNVQTYNEPFAGSLAVLLARPHAPRVETVNDLDCYLANFWRAVQHDPDAVAFHADGPVNEADLHARHRWLVEHARATAERVMTEPDFFDAKIAGWWVWGQCLWIGSGWCQSVQQQQRGDGQRPDLSVANGRGVITASSENPSNHRKRPGASRTGTRRRGPSEAAGESRSRPGRGRSFARCAGHRRPSSLARRRAGWGLRCTRAAPVPAEAVLAGDAGAVGKFPSLSQGGNDRSGNGRGMLSEGVRSEGLYDYMSQLAHRLRRVRVCCGDWKRVLTPSVTTYVGTCGVFLDPPYQHDLRERCYSEDHDISAEVRAWALENGDNPDMRIALCGYEGEHDMPDTWECVHWKAHGGYSRTARGVANRSRERIWFSPHCLSANLFSEQPA